MTPGIDRQRLWEHLRVLGQEIGPRLSGTPGDERAVEYICGQFRRWGAPVEVQDFPCPAWEHESTELGLVAETGVERIPAVAQTFTQGCDVEAPLVGVASREELEFAPDLEGKVLVLHGRAAIGLNVDRNYNLLSAEERHPAAIIVVSPNETVSTKLLRDPFLRVPGAAAARSVGERLLSCNGRSLRLRIRAHRYDSTGHNVVGRLPGESAERITVAAHYDTAAGVSGATDNASGTAALLALCQAFTTAGPRRLTIDFVAYGAEEYGRHGGNLGAVEYARHNAREVKLTQALVELDCIGTVAAPLHVLVPAWPASRSEDKAETLGFLRELSGCVVDDRSEDPSAKTALYLPDVPSIALNDEYNRLPIHTLQDTIDLMRPEAFAHAADAAITIIQHLSS